jgi:type IV pilus assembly protein PilQ
MNPWTGRPRTVTLAVLGPALLAFLWTAPARAQDRCLARLPAEPVSVNLREANLQTALRVLARQYRINVVITEEVTGSVTLDFFQVPVRDVFRSVLEAANLQCTEVGSALRISTVARVKQEEDERARVEDARSRAEVETRRKQIEAQREQAELDLIVARGPIREETIRLHYADAEDVARTLQGILGLPPEGVTPPPLPVLYQPPPPVVIGAQPAAPPAAPAPAPTLSVDALARGLTIKAHKPTNSIFLRYYANDLERIRRLVKEQLDVALPQVQIAARMVITTQNALEQLGVQWGGAAFGRPRGASGPALLGTGYASSPLSATGIPVPPAGGTAARGLPSRNPNFTGSGLLPVDPVTGFPVGGSLVNLPTAFLPTVANPALGILFGIISSDFNINLAIQALEIQGKARSLAEPKVVTVENAKAVISRGFEVPFVSSSGIGGTQVQFKDALLQLQVTPNVIEENGTTRIRMRVLIENNEPDFSQSVAGNPPIFKRRGETEVVVREGERLVIGGVLSETANSTVRQVPLLGRIPVLGWLFKSREISSTGEELIVIITPSVVRHPG